MKANLVTRLTSIFEVVNDEVLFFQIGGWTEESGALSSTTMRIDKRDGSVLDDEDEDDDEDVLIVVTP